MKKRIKPTNKAAAALAAAALFILSPVPAGSEEDLNQVVQAVVRPIVSGNQAIKDYENFFGLNNRFFVGFDFTEDFKPEVYLEDVIPLYHDEEFNQTFFLQPRVNYNGDDRDFYNLGVGYREYWKELNALAGINFFGDYQRDPGHARYGMGGEILTPHWDLRVNGYFRMSPRRRIEDTGTSVLYERVVNGMDAEFGVPLPYLPWIKAFVGGEIYDLKYSENNSYSWKGRLEFEPIEGWVVNLHINDRTDLSDPEWRVETRFRLSFDGFSKKDIYILKPYKEKSTEDIRLRALDRVERQHRIVTERYGESKTGGFTFEIGRT